MILYKRMPMLPNRLFKILFMVIFAVLIFARPQESPAQEVISEFSDKTLPVLNEELRKIRKAIQEIATQDTGIF